MTFLGFVLVIAAGVFQGTFILPMTMTDGWDWEHSWGMFALFGMLLLNWVLAAYFLPDLIGVYEAAPGGTIGLLVLFGTGWGIGAVLFGLGMDRLGMALGYPIIMGLIASMGALIPLVGLYPGELLEPRGLILLAGTAVVVLGITYCARGAARKEGEAEPGDETSKTGTFAGNLFIALAAGILSALPNLGVAFGGSVIDAAQAGGATAGMAGNAVWALFFAMGFVVNAVYCGYLITKNGSWGRLTGANSLSNYGLVLVMGLMWIGSFYLYGVGARYLGEWGVIIGWPLFIGLSIVVGNLWGLWQGEWEGAGSTPRRMLATGVGALLMGVIIVAYAKALG